MIQLQFQGTIGKNAIKHFDIPDFDNLKCLEGFGPLTAQSFSCLLREPIIVRGSYYQVSVDGIVALVPPFSKKLIPYLKLH